MIFNLLTNGNIALNYSVTTCEQEAKEFARSGGSGMNHSTAVVNFDVFQLSYPVSSTSYGQTSLIRTLSGPQKMSVLTGVLIKRVKFKKCQQ